jgi:hypothetical protein
MSKLVLSGDTSGSVTLDAPAVSGTTVLTLPTSTGTVVTTTSNPTFTGTVKGQQNGLIIPYQYYRLNSTVAGANATGAQSALGVGVTLEASTQYEFEGSFILQKTSGTTSHTVGFNFGGTATLNNIQYVGLAGYSSTLQPADVNAMGSSYFFITNSASNINATAGSLTTANNLFVISVKGTISINAGGTLIPQYQLSAAPGGAYTTQIGSYFKIAPLAASGSNVNIGTWG